ncbi:hypothetical protein BP5796_07376 [Coleophoma crateriformis]|uniref:Uncharacterized protein n=1 Tax=Coleophoma crateriformis TaxID=565419 RepID=A0A3D8RJ68_9HELO|nr:hypothetical protein BP5796_07376 [Coleophoma crateriformis]
MRPSSPLARFPAMPPESSALPAIFEACPNLSQREKARVLVMVILRAITRHRGKPPKISTPHVSFLVSLPLPRLAEELTNKRQPNKHELHQGEDREADPEQGLRVEGKPEEARVGRVDDLGGRVRGFKDPVRVAGLGIDFVPPAQAHEPPAGDVLEVVEVDGEEEDGDDEDEDAARRGWSAGLLEQKERAEVDRLAGSFATSQHRNLAGAALLCRDRNGSKGGGRNRACLQVIREQ